MYSDKKCVVCGILMPNSHHLKQYCSKCIKVIRKNRYDFKQDIRKRRDEEYNNLSEKEKGYLLDQARIEIMKDLQHDSSDTRHKY